MALVSGTKATAAQIGPLAQTTMGLSFCRSGHAGQSQAVGRKSFARTADFDYYLG
jgi:hypothetical protein